MYIIIATDYNGVSRAFIAESEYKMKKLRKDLADWGNVIVTKVDCIMYNLLKIKTN